jgi:hypothetical protein
MAAQRQVASVMKREEGVWGGLGFERWQWHWQLCQTLASIETRELELS